MTATLVALPVAGIVAWQVSRTQQVVIAGRPATAEARRACAALVLALPDALGELSRRAVHGDRSSTAAWGDPPVALRCGAPAPAGPVGEVIEVDGVAWAPVTDATGVTWTTTGRRPTVVVRFPKRYDSQGPLVARLSPAIRAAAP